MSADRPSSQLVGTHTTPCIYEIPASFSGWVSIEFSVPSAPPLPLEGGQRVVRVPPGGALRTSSPQELGVLHHSFFLVDEAGRRSPLDEPEAHPGADPNSAYQSYPAPVVLGFRTGDTVERDGHRVFEGFYVGRGPAGDAPDWPAP